ncbi:FxsA family protein [Mesorhizobium sp. BE184]|uniref:FxsA family protein n=1 Tax=Mesorhizobium sp. BE184 TaxID=2817714 RepID=UPI00285B6FC3|nr:FxsA family protein [Mesorhizobium sp. BE184]MDR7033797.1 UPF0716 protein FxsA [Mesorhizobium sp. BE184]
MRISFLPLLVLALPILEIAGFVVVGREIGVLATVGLVLLSALVGTFLLRQQGFGVMSRVRAEMDAGRNPGRQLAHGLIVLIAAMLLIVPGFISDILGILLFIPAVRDFAWRFLKNRVSIVANFSGGGFSQRRKEKVIDLDSDDYSRRPDPSSPWRRLKDDKTADD